MESAADPAEAVYLTGAGKARTEFGGELFAAPLKPCLGRGNEARMDTVPTFGYRIPYRSIKGA